MAMGIVAGMAMGIAAGMAMGIAAEAAGISVATGETPVAQVLFCPRQRPCICSRLDDNSMTEPSVFIRVLPGTPQKIPMYTKHITDANMVE
jgi:hypothetical protein